MNKYVIVEDLTSYGMNYEIWYGEGVVATAYDRDTAQKIADCLNKIN